ncbi:MAG: hypothetical protein ACI9MC_003730 [Kiritimatiellia bacterium]|jgi:hypothetical protein
MLNGPELDLLQEVLSEDPTADIYLDVAAALIEREEWRKASRILKRAIEAGVHDLKAARMLAVSAGQAHDYIGVSLAVKHIGRDVVANDPDLARSWALALDAQGELEQAGQLANHLLDQGGPDEQLSAVIERQLAPPPSPRLCGQDPWFTVNRAEAYLDAGRIDLALRTYRRIHASHPDDSRVHARMLRLSSLPRDSRPWIDDLSQEYWSSAPVKSLAMPTSTLVPSVVEPEWNADEEHTDPVHRRPSEPTATPPHTDDEATVLFRAGQLPPELQRARSTTVDSPSVEAFDDQEITQTNTVPIIQSSPSGGQKASQKARSEMIIEESTDVFSSASTEDIIEQARRIEREAALRGRSKQPK